MAGEIQDEENLFRSVVINGILAALWTGRADPAPLNRPWPVPLRWTRYIGIGRLQYGLVVNLVGLGLTVRLIGGTYSLLVTPSPWGEPPPSSGTALLIAVSVVVPLALRDRHPLAAWRLSFVATLTMDVSGWQSTPYVPAGVFVAIACVYTVAVRCS